MRPSHALGVAFVMAVATCVALVGRTVTPHRPPPGADSATVDAFGPSAVRKVRDATVRVSLPVGHGVGFCRRSADGTVWVWTCAHVAVHANLARGVPNGGGPELEHYVPLRVRHRTHAADDRPLGDSEFEAVVVKLDESIDLALLRLTAKNVNVGTLDWADEPPQLWSPVLACGSPRGWDSTVTRGVVNYRSRRGPFGVMDQIDAPTIGGNSGGPVVAPGGKVVGLLSGGVGENFGLLVTARCARLFALEHGLMFAFEGNAAAPDTVPGPVSVPTRP